jgi:outer membrane protein
MLLTIPVQGAEAGPIGYVDMQVLLDKSKMGQQAQQSLKEKFAPKQQELAEEEQSIRQLQQTLERDGPLMSKEESEKRKAEVQERIRAFQLKAAKAQQELVQEQGKVGKEIFVPAQAIIAAVAKDKQVSVVFERQQSGLIYIDESLDLTAEVVKRLDAQASK